MFILQRYIIRQHIGPFLFGFFVITLIWILNLLFTRLGHLLSRGLSFAVIMEFFILNMAWIVALTLPMAVLMSCLMAFGRMSSDYEITAMKASGISFYRLLLPVFIVSILLCLFLVYFNNHILPDANHRLALLMRDIQKKRPTISLEPGIIYREIPKIHLLVETVQEEEGLSYVRGVMIQDRNDPNINKTIIAEQGEIAVVEADGILRITLYDGEIHEIPKDKTENYRKLEFPKQVLTIPIPDMIMTRSESDYRSDREQSAQMMLDEVRKNREAINRNIAELNKYTESQIRKYFPATQDGEQLVSQRSSSLAALKFTNFTLQNNIQKQINYNKNLAQRSINSFQIINNYLTLNSRLLVEVHKKYSIPFACIVFALIGAPLGIMTRRGGMAIGGGISLIFFLIYWLFLIGGEELADRRLLSPFWAMWMANILVGFAGTYLVIRTVKESALIDFDKIKSYFRKT